MSRPCTSTPGGSGSRTTSGRSPGSCAAHASFIHASMRTTPVDSSWTIAGTRPSASKATAAISASVCAMGVAIGMRFERTAGLRHVRHRFRWQTPGRDPHSSPCPRTPRRAHPPRRHPCRPLVLAPGPGRPRRSSRTSRPRTATPTRCSHRPRALRTALFEEIRGRVQETDVSPPARKGPWEYFTRTFEGSQYAAHGRRPAGTCRGRRRDGDVLDENELADGLEYFSLGGLALSPDQALLAYSFDDDGGERHTLRFRDLATGTRPRRRDRRHVLRPGLGERQPHRLLRPARRRDASVPGVAPHARRRRATSCVFHEADERFFVSVGRARSGRLIARQRPNPS